MTLAGTRKASTASNSVERAACGQQPRYAVLNTAHGLATGKVVVTSAADEPNASIEPAIGRPPMSEHLVDVDYPEARLRVANRLYKARNGVSGPPTPWDFIEADAILAEIASWKAVPCA